MAAVTFVVSLGIGSRATSPLAVWQALFGRGDAAVAALVSARLARAVLAAVVGVCAGMSGVLLQGLTRNPIADPGLLGMTAGGSMVVVIVMQVLGLATPTVIAVSSFVGVSLAAVVVAVIGLRVPRRRQALTMLLVGAAVMACANSIISALLVTNAQSLDLLRHWQVGSVSGVGLARLPGVLPFLLVGLALAMSSGRSLDALSLGEDTAHSLGHSVVRQRVMILGAAVLLTASATALAGPIAAVGLVAPHLVRRIVGVSHTPLLIGSAIAGATIVIVADTLGRVVAPPSEVAVGIMTAVIGAPVLLALARKAVSA